MQSLLVPNQIPSPLMGEGQGEGEISPLEKGRLRGIYKNEIPF